MFIISKSKEEDETYLDKFKTLFPGYDFTLNENDYNNIEFFSRLLSWCKCYVFARKRRDRNCSRGLWNLLVPLIVKMFCMLTNLSLLFLYSCYIR